MNATEAQVSDQPVSPGLVLHISASSIPDPATPIDQWIAQAGLEPVRCPDVYLGLARALRSQSGFSAAVVYVEDLTNSEFEFFSILSRSRREMPVFVYGSRHPDRIVRALESGARGLASREAILALGAAAARRMTAGAAPVAALPIPAPSPAVAPFAEPIGAPVVPSVTAPEIAVSRKPESVQHAPDHVLAQEVPRESQMAEDESASSVSEPADASAPEIAPGSSEARVPWLRYAGGPIRQGPGAQARPVRERVRPAPPAVVDGKSVAQPEKVQEAAPMAAIKPCLDEREYEPLLTEQELAALLGDDLGEIALQEREMLTGEGEVPGGGTR